MVLEWKIWSKDGINNFQERARNHLCVLSWFVHPKVKSSVPLPLDIFAKKYFSDARISWLDILLFLDTTRSSKIFLCIVPCVDLSMRGMRVCMSCSSILWIAQHSQTYNNDKNFRYALMITENTIVIGGGVKTTEALLLSADLQSGHSKPCLLFKSPSLIEGEKFNVTNIEVFCVCSDLPWFFLLNTRLLNYCCSNLIVNWIRWLHDSVLSM